jgi:hypothetical protein
MAVSFVSDDATVSFAEIIEFTLRIGHALEPRTLRATARAIPMESVLAQGGCSCGGCSM